jgi:hypothetical protein
MGRWAKCFRKRFCHGCPTKRLKKRGHYGGGCQKPFAEALSSLLKNPLTGMVSWGHPS